MTNRKLQFFQVLPQVQGPGGDFVQPLVAQLPWVQRALTLIEPFQAAPGVAGAELGPGHRMNISRLDLRVWFSPTKTVGHTKLHLLAQSQPTIFSAPSEACA